ncbi:DUF6479 family protein, partial [Streptomyces echinoruber]|uniref:DUF6479 family protein n=2 Tax=Streptomyces echinoruber TaxID=68898 RepID=UPI00167D8ED8
MDASTYVMALTAHQWNVAGAFAGGIFVAAGLIWAVVAGIGVMMREPGPPDPEDQPHLPDGGPVHEVREVREADEVPRSDGKRLMPYELHPCPTRTSEHQDRPRWTPGSSGAG